MKSSISAWLSIRLIGILFVSMALILVPTTFVLNSYFTNYEKRTLLEQSNRTLLILKNSQKQLDATVKDYAEWDETYDFVRNLSKAEVDSDYVAENFSFANFTTLQLSFVLILDSNKRVIYQRSYNDRGDLKVIDEPADFKVPKDTSDHTPHIHWIGNTPALISEHLIINPEDQKKNGVLVFGSILDSSKIYHIQEISGIEFKILKNVHDDENEEDDGNSDEDHNELDFSHDIHTENNFWISHLQVNPYFGIEVSRNPLLLKESSSTFSFLISNILMQLLILVFATRYLFNKGILTRIKSFAQLALQFRKEKNFNLRWQSKEQDELGELAGALNSMMQEIKTQNEAIEHLANNDHLTELHNRRSFIHRLNGVLVLKKYEPDLEFTVAMMDLDGFKQVNDNYGHDAGDHVLKVIALRVRDLLRDEDIFARLGGDEFAYIFTSTSVQEAWAVSNYIRSKIEEPIEFKGHQLLVSCSTGLCDGVESHEVTELLKFCDLALYQAKHQGKRQSCIYKNEIQGNCAI